MLSLRPIPAATAMTAPHWAATVFAARAVGEGTILRRSIREVEKDMGRQAFETEVKKRGYHLIECGEHYIVICNPDRLRVIC